MRWATSLPVKIWAALREIALRRTADRLNRTAQRTGNEHAARAGEHILICLSPAPSNAKVIRTAARMAEAFHSGFTALLVQTPEIKEVSGENAKRLRENLRLAEQLGAQIATVYGDDPAVQIAEYARASGVTKIVMGRVNHRQNTFMGKKSLADRLIQLTGNLDVYIIPDQQPLYKKRHKQLLRREEFVFRWRDVGKMLLVLALATALGFAFDRTMFSDSNIITVYILGVLVTAVWTSGHIYGAISAMLSVAAFNYFFIDPRWTFDVTDPGYPSPLSLCSLPASSLLLWPPASSGRHGRRHRSPITQSCCWAAVKNCSAEKTSGRSCRSWQDSSAACWTGRFCMRW